jgi:hypothetical protein
MRQQARSSMRSIEMATANAEHRQVHWRLPVELVERIEALAAEEGNEAEAIAARILSTGSADVGLTAGGRCSVRTGLCSEGPTPLALQQDRAC